jgi:hypothetical protein
MIVLKLRKQLKEKSVLGLYGAQANHDAMQEHYPHPLPSVRTILVFSNGMVRLMITNGLVENRRRQVGIYQISRTNMRSGTVLILLKVYFCTAERRFNFSMGFPGTAVCSTPTPATR